MATSDTKRKAKVVKGKDLKDFRHAVSVLKKRGVVSKRVDARSQKATRYMMAKVRKFNDVIEGRAVVVTLSQQKTPEKKLAFKSALERYREGGGLETRGNVIVVPEADKGQSVNIVRDMVQTVRPLKNGEEERVYLPFKMTDLPRLIDRMIKESDSLDALKLPDEYFSFRIGENNSQVPFLTFAEMAEYMVKYSTRYDEPITNAKQTRELLTFQRFKTTNNEFMRNPSESGKPKLSYPKVDHRGRNFEIEDKERRLRNARKQARRRKRETPEQKTRRLNANARRSAQWRQRQFEGD